MSEEAYSENFSLRQQMAVQLVRHGCLQFAGDSMFPVLQDGDQVCPRLEGEPRLGDLMVFSLHGEICIHRVMAVTPDGWLTRGDACRRMDPPVSRDAFLGLLDGLYDPQTQKSRPFRKQRAFYNGIFCRLAGSEPWRAWIGFRLARLAWKFSGH